MLRTRLASATAALSAVLLFAGGGTALASQGGGGGGGGGAPAPPPPPAGTPAISISPPSVSFGPQAVGTASAPQTVTVTNTGTASVFFNAESQGGNNVLDFTDTNSQCVGLPLAPGASCALTLGFKPTATGTRTGTVQLFDNAPGSPQIINLSGTGTSTAGPTPLSVDTTGLTCTSGVCALNDGTTLVNNFYFSSLGVLGDTQPPFTWTLVGGALPTGLALTPDGHITGTPTATGTSTFTVMVTDPAGKTATQAFSITIAPPPALGPAGCPKIGGQPNAVSASMSGPAIAGRPPSGQAVLDESRVTTCGGFSVLNASVSNVNLPDNTVLWFYFDSRLVGRVGLVNGSAKMAPFNLGDYLSRKDSVSVYDTPPPLTTLEPSVLSSGFLQ